MVISKIALAELPKIFSISGLISITWKICPYKFELINFGALLLSLLCTLKYSYLLPFSTSGDHPMLSLLQNDIRI